jgi:hypothetical protein
MPYDEFFLFGISRGTAYLPRSRQRPFLPAQVDHPLRRRLGHALEQVGDRVAATGRAWSATPLSLAELDRI